MSDLSWQQAALGFASEEWCSSRDELFAHLRKVHAHPPTRREFREWAKNSEVLPGLLVSRPDDSVSREELLEAENRELRARLSKDRKGEVQSERVVKAVEEALKSHPPRARLGVKPPVVKGAHHSHLLLLSDFHGGEVVDPDVVSGTNRYSWEIMEERVRELLASVLSHKKNSPPANELVVWFGGDMLSGSNHEELAVTNEYPLAEQAVKMGALMAYIVGQLSEHYKSIRVYVVEGNHPRLVQKPAAKEPHNSGDWIAGVFMEQAVKSVPNVDVTVGRGSVQFEIAGRRVYAWHGDGVRSSMPGVPEGGIARRVNAIQAMLPQRVDVWVHGHFHTAYAKQGGRIIGNGSLKGNDEYVQKSFGGGDPPTQLLVEFDQAASRLTGIKYITPQAGLPR